MKRTILKAISLALVLCMALTACGKSEKPDKHTGSALSDAVEKQSRPTGAPETAEAPETTEAPASQSYGDHLLENLQYEGTYGFGDGSDGCDFSYEIPQILDDTPDARELNEGLKKLCQDAVDEIAFNYSGISWESHWNGSLLSLVIEFWPPYTSDVDYFTYNYDFELGASLSNEDLFERAGTNWLQMDLAMRRAAAAKFDADGVLIYENYNESFFALAELRAYTLSYENLNPGSNPMYLDDQGQLHFFTLIGTPAGGGSYAQDLIVDLNPPEGVRKQAVCDFVTADLENNQVDLTFHKTDMAEAFLPTGFSDYDLSYMVQGLYGEYTEMTVGFIGNGGNLFLLLTDTNGQVTFCNITNGFNCDMQFFAVGPMELQEDAVGFENVNDGGGSLLYATSETGSLMLLDPFILDAEATLPFCMADSTWYTEDMLYSLNLSTTGPYTWGAGGGVAATGYAMPYLGTTDSGMHFMLQMITEEGQFAGALATLSCPMDESLPDSGQALYIVQSMGPHLPGVSQGGNAVLYQVVG